MSDFLKKPPTDFIDVYLFQLREPQILKRSMWVQYVRSKMLIFLGAGVLYNNFETPGAVVPWTNVTKSELVLWLVELYKLSRPTLFFIPLGSDLK